MKWLVTGAGGFVASRLIELLLEKGEDIVGSYRWNEDLNRAKPYKDKIKMVPADLLDFVSLFRMIADNKPDVISHLAAQSYVNDGYSNPLVTIETNGLGTVNLLEAIRLYKDYVDSTYDPIIHVCSSSEYYGKVDESETPITEMNEVRPGNQYAVGKVCADAAAAFYSAYYKMKIIRTRFFTHTGYGRTMLSAECNFARQIARIEKGLQEPVIKHGNLHSVRTWANVKDAVTAYYLLTQSGVPGEVYNIGGKIIRTIGETLDCLISLSTNKNIKKELDPELVRKLDVNLQIVDISKFENTCGWTPQISFEQTMQEVLDFWRENT
jgi:GDP-mannose 4,6-dehydratase